MYQNFTGSSRRPRQVNLSSRNPNPFAQLDPRAHTTPAQGSQSALAKAHADRLARQHDRERSQAAARIQRIYRGHKDRKAFRDAQRRRWDEDEGIDGDAMSVDGQDECRAYADEAEAIQQLKGLLRFGILSDHDDLVRAWRFFRRMQLTGDKASTSFGAGPWPESYLKLEGRCLDALDTVKVDQDRQMLLSMTKHLAGKAPLKTYNQASHFYRAVASALSHGTADIDLIAAPLEVISPSTLAAYQGFVALLQLPDLAQQLQKVGSLDQLADRVNCKLLGSALAHLLRNDLYYALKRDTSNQHAETDRWIWLLAHVIYFYRHAHAFESAEKYASEDDFVFVVATILSALVNHIEVEAQPVELDHVGTASSSGLNLKLVPPFVRDQILSLVNQASIGGLLAQMRSNPASDISEQQSLESNRPRLLANYILTLLRLFPRKGDDIRLWLYLDSPSTNKSGSTSVISLFWRACHGSSIFKEIVDEPRAAIDLLKPDTSASDPAKVAAASSARQAEIDDQWRLILMFIGMYTFVLKVMDDEEFFADARSSETSGRVDSSGRQNSLRLAEIEQLVTFLKHLGFTMYYNASDITATHAEDERRNISLMFQSAGQDHGPGSTAAARAPPNHIAGIQGISLDYFKGLVTGLLRAIYERDSRRPFLPKNHWLMTSRFDMTNFIDAVVEEEERRSKVQEEDDEDDKQSDGEEHDQSSYQHQSSGLVGTGHAQRIQRQQRLQRQQRKQSRQRYLQTVAPRLEILQNMPFLIPFATRVQIFRRFVLLDQLRRRNGYADPEMWRLAQSTGSILGTSNPLERHHAKIRREHEFEDAFEQFYELGAALKEPIQITFVDQFDTPEAGIDGGGVTKEFLTSVTSQAFAPSEGIQMFCENEKNLLYPNPTAVDEQRELSREAGLPDADPEARRAVAELLRRYEFLGRIIGKCLYEGILVDIRFVGFFLLKWALTGGVGAAARESGYRANLNDLRDLDEGLYQGLIQLKNYAGDVEDFALNFTITDTLTLPAFPSASAALSASRVERRRKEKTLTRDLQPGGSNLPVTNANRLVYISGVARHRLSAQPAAQTMAFLRGLAGLVQPSWLSMFNQAELQTLVSGGEAPIDVADLRRHTTYGGVYVVGDDGLEHESVRLFWRVMEGLDDADRRAVLKFVTSTPRAPLLGFGSLTPRFSIRDSGDDEARLPSTSTCVNLLKLPRYRSAAACRAKLLLAVRSGAGFDLS